MIRLEADDKADSMLMNDHQKFLLMFPHSGGRLTPTEKFSNDRTLTPSQQSQSYENCTCHY
jgi:hypothetical protein